MTSFRRNASLSAPLTLALLAALWLLPVWCAAQSDSASETELSELLQRSGMNRLLEQLSAQAVSGLAKHEGSVEPGVYGALRGVTQSAFDAGRLRPVSSENSR